jgi:hypothetical protein
MLILIPRYGRGRISKMRYGRRGLVADKALQPAASLCPNPTSAPLRFQQPETSRVLRSFENAIQLWC